MSGENLVALSNLAVQTNNCSEKKAYSRVGTASSIAFAFLLEQQCCSIQLGEKLHLDIILQDLRTYNILIWIKKKELRACIQIKQ